MTAYYNEFDPCAAQWLRNLIAAGHIAPGEVDERSITEVSPDDVRDFTQAHFFAGLGGWSYAARLAGVADDQPLWTGSCPCQPFSSAGKQRGTADERHLWPVWFRLIRAVRPVRVLGEQVEAAVRLGWLDAVQSDLEAEDYAFGAVVLGAHSVGAPHIRQRLWFVADAGCERRDGQSVRLFAGPSRSPGDEAAGGRATCLVSDADDAGPQGRVVGRDGADERTAGPSGVVGGVAYAERHAAEPGRATEQPGEGDAASGAGAHAQSGRRGDAGIGAAAGGFWADADWLPCRDGKARPVEPGLFPLAHGVSARVGRLRAAGNAIVPQVAAEFIAAVMECRP